MPSNGNSACKATSKSPLQAVYSLQGCLFMAHGKAVKLRSLNLTLSGKGGEQEAVRNRCLVDSVGQAARATASRQSVRQNLTCAAAVHVTESTQTARSAQATFWSPLRVESLS